MFLEQLLNAALGWIVSRGVIPFHKQLPSLCFGQQRQVANLLRGTINDSLEQSLEVTHQSLDRFRLKQFGIRFEPANQLLAAFGDVQQQIELRERILDPQMLDR